MTLEKRLKDAEEKGYTPVMISGESTIFFVKNGDYRIGSVLTDAMRIEYVVKYIGESGRMKATRLNKM